MPSLDKSSVRDEVSRLRENFNTLQKEGKVSSEIQVLMNSMFMIVELILAIFLEKNTTKQSKNSSIPPSQTEKDETAIGQTITRGKGKKEHAGQASNTRTREQVIVVAVQSCDECGEDLQQVESDPYERRTRIDIVFEKVIEHVEVEVKQCPTCDHVSKGTFPPDMQGLLQYGNGVKAFVVNLLVSQMVSLNRAQKLLKTLIGEVVSEASLLKFVLRLHQALDSWEAQAIEVLMQQPCLNVDETSLRVDKKNHWIHVYAGGEITLKRLHRKRGKEAMEDIGIIPRYGGIIVHDCWASYLSYCHCGRGLCGSHLLRELAFIVDAHDYGWAKKMKALLQEACKKVRKSRRKCLTQAQIATLQRRYRTILTQGEKELPLIPEKADGKRGKIAKSDAHNLWERMQKYEEAILLFAKDPHVPFTNNRAERDLRMSKVKQKVSGCFRTELYAQAYCRISSYLQTMSNKGYNPLLAIQMAFNGEAVLAMGE